MTPKIPKSRADYLWAILGATYTIALIAFDWNSGWATFAIPNYIFLVGVVLFSAWLWFRHRYVRSRLLRAMAFGAFTCSDIYRITYEGKSAWIHAFPIVLFAAMAIADVYSIRRCRAA